MGIPSVARQGAGYLREAVGSLLEGLGTQEREEMYIVVFIPHSDPAVHPAYTEDWLHSLVDYVLTYEVSESEMRHVKDMEDNDGPDYMEKGLYDYRYLLLHCAKQHTPYIAIFEDDVVAMDGWYHRTVSGIREAETLSALKHASREFLYLRLFYTEEFLGWNSEEWSSYLAWSALVFVVPMAALYSVRARYTALKARILTIRTMAIFATMVVSAIVLFFGIGRVTVWPLAPGISLMPKYGCCSQGFVFPRGRALMLTTYFADRHTGAPDVLIEDFANEKGELRWAITPSVVQHIGRKSSKKDDYGDMSKYGMSVAEKIWSFGFERLDWRALREEHDAILELRGDLSLR